MHTSLLAWLFFALASFAASSQEGVHRTVTAVSGRQTILTVHFSVNKDCSRAPPPQIRFTVLPRQGTVLIRRATARSDRVPNCKSIEAPVRVVTYYSTTGYIGEDKVAYEVRGADGSSEVNVVTIIVAPASSSPTRDNGKDSIDL